MQKKDTEIIVSEKKVPMKDVAREQVDLYLKDCAQAAKKPLKRLVDILIDRMIDWVIDAVG